VRRVFGPRTVVEAVFLVAVPVVVLVAGQSPAVIVASAAVAYLLVLVFEAVLWRNRPQGAKPADAATPAVEIPETVRVLSAPVEAEPQPEPAAAPAPEPVAPPTPEPEPLHVVEEPVRVLRPVPTPAPEPEPAPAAVEPEPQTVVALPLSSEPRQWNLWDLERLTREHAGADAARDEERSFLLMYLRDFAGPDGLLPIDFDGLVRDSFGDLVGAR
jgi:hypothetical protein